MTRKKFIKQLMAVGVSRNTAAEAAAAADRAGRPYFKVLGHLLTVRSVFAWRNGKALGQDFEYAVLRAARMTPRRIVPLRRKKRQHHDGLRVHFAAIDEMHTLGTAYRAVYPVAGRSRKEAPQA